MQRCLQFFYTSGSEDTLQAKGWGEKGAFHQDFFHAFFMRTGGSELLTWCSTCGNHRRRGNRQTDWAQAASWCSSVRYLQSSTLFSSFFSPLIRLNCLFSGPTPFSNSFTYTSCLFNCVFSPLSLPIHRVSSRVSSLSNRQRSLFLEANRAAALFYPGFVCFKVQISCFLMFPALSKESPPYFPNIQTVTPNSCRDILFWLPSIIIINFAQLRPVVLIGGDWFDLLVATGAQYTKNI